MIRAIRGATCSQNTAEDIEKNTTELLAEIFATNNIEIDDVIAVAFTCTKDLNAAYPAVAARKFGLVHASLMCMAEMDVVGSLAYCVRVQVLANTQITQDKICHIYLGEAKKLRPDLLEKGEENMLQIAIDGPSGSGKSTIAKRLSQHLDIVYVDTGALYRTAGLFAVRMGVDLDDEAAVSELTKDMRVEIKYLEGSQHTFLNGEDVSATIRLDEMGLAASSIGRYEAVRERIVGFSREIASKQSVIMDGRDIGTVVLPNANIKIFLTATVEARAKRRCGELAALLGEFIDYDEIFEQIEARDYQDINRIHSPLRQADDAIIVDATDLNIEQVVQKIMGIVEEERSKM
ncbi:MAG: (d)CMP kinase [Defluviitaleaceae bacterium]|nr:(d)CMP kinase [Defluviitaleaceae bacterium]